MKLIRRLLLWAVSFGFLSAVGVIAFNHFRSRPRCTITAPPSFELYLVGDGSRLAIRHTTNDCTEYAPLQIYSTTDGRLLSEMLGDAGIQSLVLSPNRRHAVAKTCDGSRQLHLLDLHAGLD